jgi:hypothetical protein
MTENAAKVAPEDCVVEGHWFDAIVTGNPEDHDGGLPEDPRVPCSTTLRSYVCPTCGGDGSRL